MLFTKFYDRNLKKKIKFSLFIKKIEDEYD